MKKLRTNKGFTLVELIIVIAILAIIMLIAIPNLSGVKHQTEVSADKVSAGRVGQAVRLWYTKYQVDPQFKALVDAGKDKPIEEADLPRTGLAEGLEETAMFDASTMVGYHQLPKIQDFTKSTFVPNSLIDPSTKVVSDKQIYWIGIVGTGTAEKLVVGIGDTEPTLGSVVTYTGEGPGIAYVEP